MVNLSDAPNKKQMNNEQEIDNIIQQLEDLQLKETVLTTRLARLAKNQRVPESDVPAPRAATGPSLQNVCGR